MLSNVVYLNNNDSTGLIGFGKGVIYRHSSGNLSDLQAFIDEHIGQYQFVALSYDLKNEIEDLKSNNIDGSKFPNAIIYVPEYVVQIDGDSFNFLQGESNEELKKEIKHFLNDSHAVEKAKLLPRTSKEDYLQHVQSLKNELQYGNIYEVNYCQEYFAENIHLESTFGMYQAVNAATKTPFSCYFKLDEFELLSASPERYIQRIGNQLISQPIKGTIRRGQSQEEDEQLKKQLYNDPKERSENVMIVDLVRNDLSRIATKNSVRVAELFGIYSFETVHQMISTIHCDCPKDTTFTDVLKASYPMGSMTGAPKRSAMQIIEEHEDFKRGLYSGSVGYIDPRGDFDLNVVIRSVLYNRKEQYLSCSVGGAITIQSDPLKEYEECQTKIQKILSIIDGED